MRRMTQMKNNRIKSNDPQAGIHGQFYIKHILESHFKGTECFEIEDHIYDRKDTWHIDFDATRNCIYYRYDVKTSLDYLESVTIKNNHYYLLKDNLGHHNCFILLFSGINRFPIIESTEQFKVFLDTYCKRSPESNYYVITYNDILKYGNFNYIEWINLPITFEKLFNDNFKREDWNIYTDEEIKKRSTVIEEFYETNFGKNSDIM